MKNVLVLDNDLYFANAMKIFFQKIGAVCTISDNGNDAINFISNNRYDLVICCTQLGYKNGIELIQIMKSNLDRNDTPLILVTPNNNPIMNTMFSELDASAIIHKPVNFNTLTKILVDLTENTSSVDL